LGRQLILHQIRHWTEYQHQDRLEEELNALPGIGPVKAQAIIGTKSCSKPEDIMKVPWTDEKTIRKD
jgi:helix-hairpin-helix protein